MSFSYYVPWSYSITDILNHEENVSSVLRCRQNQVHSKFWWLQCFLNSRSGIKTFLLHVFFLWQELLCWCVLWPMRFLLYRYLVCLHDALNFKKWNIFKILLYTFHIFHQVHVCYRDIKIHNLCSISTSMATCTWRKAVFVRSTSCSHIEEKMFWRIPMATLSPNRILESSSDQK